MPMRTFSPARRCWRSCWRRRAATALLVRRRLAHLDRLELALASVVVGTAVLIAVHLVPLVLGMLTPRRRCSSRRRWRVGLAALVVPARRAGAGARRTDGPPPRRRAAGRRGRSRRSPARSSRRPPLADLGRWAGDELVGVDPLTFHLPNVGRWIQDGTVWQIDQFVPLLAQGYYPNNGDVVLLSAVLPWHNDFLVRLPITFFLAATAVAVFAVARELRAPHAAAVLAAAASSSLPVVGLATIPRALPDSLMWSTFACGVLFPAAPRAHRRGARTSCWPASRSRSPPGRSGTASARSPSSWSSGSAARLSRGRAAAVGNGDARRRAPGRPRAAATPPARSRPSLARRRPRRRPGAARHAGLARCATSSLSGNPVFPLKVAPFGVTIFDAPPDVIRDQAGFSIADYAGDPAVLRQLAGEIVEGLGGAPLVCARRRSLLALAARPAPRARARRARARCSSPGAVALGARCTPSPRRPRSACAATRRSPTRNTRYAVPALLLAMPVVAWRGRAPAAARRPRAGGRAGRRRAARRLQWLRGRAARATSCSRSPASQRSPPPPWLLWRLRARRRSCSPAPPSLPRSAASPPRTAIAGRASTTGAIAASTRRSTRCSTRRRRHGRGIGARERLVGRRPVAGLAGLRDPDAATTSSSSAVRRGLPHALPRRGALPGGAATAARFDVLVVGRGFYPPQPTREQRWAIDAGWRTIALSAAPARARPPGRSERLAAFSAVGG